MKNIDFGVLTHDGTIFKMCFDQYLTARFTLKKPEEEWMKLVPKTEKVFFSLIEKAKSTEAKLEEILQTPDSSGDLSLIHISEPTRPY